MRSDYIVIPLTDSELLDPLHELETAAVESVNIRPEDFRNAEELMAAHPDANVYNFLPGDYTSWGFMLFAPWSGAAKPLVGTPERRKILCFADHTVPWRRGSQAIFAGLSLWGCSNVIVTGLTFNGPVILERTSNNVVVHHNYFEKNPGYCVRVFGNNNKVQRNLCFRQALRDGRTALTDEPAIQISPVDVARSTHNNHILDNEIVDWNDGIVFTGNKSLLHKPIPGTVVDGNDIHVSTDRYLYENEGVYADIENGFDFKIGSDDPNNPIIVSNNRISGFRYVAPSLISQGKGANGAAITNHFASRNILFRNNIVGDCPIGWIEHGWLPNYNENLVEPRGTRFENNIWYGIQRHSPSDTIDAVMSTSVPVSVHGDKYLSCTRVAPAPNPSWVGPNTVDEILHSACDVGPWQDYIDVGQYNQPSGLSILYQTNRLTGPKWQLLMGTGSVNQIIGNIR